MAGADLELLARGRKRFRDDGKDRVDGEVGAEERLKKRHGLGESHVSSGQFLLVFKDDDAAQGNGHHQQMQRAIPQLLLPH